MDGPLQRAEDCRLDARAVGIGGDERAGVVDILAGVGDGELLAPVVALQRRADDTFERAGRAAPFSMVL